VVAIVWQADALDDLRVAHQFIARDYPRSADRLVERIVRSTRHIESFPEMGRVVPEIGRGDVRELIVGGYRVIYLVRSERVEIHAVWHGARRLRDLPGI